MLNKIEGLHSTPNILQRQDGVPGQLALNLGQLRDNFTEFLRRKIKPIARTPQALLKQPGGEDFVRGAVLRQNEWKGHMVKGNIVEFDHITEIPHGMYHVEFKRKGMVCYCTNADGKEVYGYAASVTAIYDVRNPALIYAFYDVT